MLSSHSPKFANVVVADTHKHKNVSIEMKKTQKKTDE